MDFTSFAHMSDGQIPQMAAQMELMSSHPALIKAATTLALRQDLFAEAQECFGLLPEYDGICDADAVLATVLSHHQVALCSHNRVCIMKL